MENNTDGRSTTGGRENGGKRRKGRWPRLRIGQIRIDIENRNIDIITGERQVMNIDITIVEKRVMAIRVGHES